MAIQNGTKQLSTLKAPPIRPLIAEETPDGMVAIPMPSPLAMHGVELPGGNLHLPVSESAPGFMLPEHLIALQAATARLQEFPALFAPKDHQHPQQPPLPHEHVDLAQKIKEVWERLQEYQKVTAESLEARPIIDPSHFAEKGHSHPPHPLPNHDHPHTHEVASVSKSGLMPPEALTRISRLEQELEQRSQELAELREMYLGVRKMLDDFPRQAPMTLDHGNLIGGSLHQTVNPRQAGFATPDMLNKVEMLWKERSEAKNTP